MTTAKIDPLYLRSQITEMLLYRDKCYLQIIRILFTESMKMNTIQQIQKLRIFPNCFIPLSSCCTHTASRCTGIINLMTFLGRTFRIDPKSHTLSCFLCHQSKPKKLRRRIKHNVICITKQFFKFICPIAGAEYVDFLSRHFFCTQPCLKQSAGLCTCKVWFKKSITVIVTECLLRQKHLTSCSFSHFTEKLCVFYKCIFIQDIAGSFYIPKFRRNDSAGGCKWCSFIQFFH